MVNEEFKGKSLKTKISLGQMTFQSLDVLLSLREEITVSDTLHYL